MAQSIKGQGPKGGGFGRRDRGPREAVIVNPKAKLLDQVRDVMRLRHYSIRTEQSYCDQAERG